MTCTCSAQYMSGTGGGKPGEWGREGYRWQKKKDWEVGFLKGWKAGEICINKNNATIMLNLLQSKKSYREDANQKERQKLGKQGIYLFIYLFISFSGHRPAQRECERMGLGSHARCHPYPIPQV